MHPYWTGRVDALFEHEDEDGTLSLFSLPVLGFDTAIGPPLVKHPDTGETVFADEIPGYFKSYYSPYAQTVFHFCRTGLEGEPVWKVHYAKGTANSGFTFRGE